MASQLLQFLIDCCVEDPAVANQQNLSFGIGRHGPPPNRTSQYYTPPSSAGPNSPRNPAPRSTQPQSILKTGNLNYIPPAFNSNSNHNNHNLLNPPPGTGPGVRISGVTGNLNYVPPATCSEDESDNSGEEQLSAEQVEAMRRKFAGSARASVSAESQKSNSGSKSGTNLGSEDNSRRSSWVPPIYLKTPDVRDRLKGCLNRSFLLRELDEDAKNVVVAAFQEHKVGANVPVIIQGTPVSATEPGLFVLEKGICSAFKLKTGKPEYNTNNNLTSESDKTSIFGPKVYCYDQPGGSFGELALLYNANRAASVISESECQLWSIDRTTFNHTVRGAGEKRREKFKAFLNTVDALKSCLEESETGANIQDKLADVLIQRSFKKGEKIINEGDQGKEFFMLERGSAEAVKNGKVVMKYSEAGAYFGELALLEDIVRQADVVASSDNCRCFVLQKESFVNLVLGGRGGRGSSNEAFKKKREEYQRKNGE